MTNNELLMCLGGLTIQLLGNFVPYTARLIGASTWTKQTHTVTIIYLSITSFIHNEPDILISGLSLERVLHFKNWWGIFGSFNNWWFQEIRKICLRNFVQKVLWIRITAMCINISWNTLNGFWVLSGRNCKTGIMLSMSNFLLFAVSWNGCPCHSSKRCPFFLSDVIISLKGTS